MSMIKTLAKVAIGVAIAKGVGAMVQGASAGRGGSSGGARPSTGPAGRQTTGAAPGGLEDLMGSVLGGGAKPASKAAPAPVGRPARENAPDTMGGLGGLLEQLAGARAGAPGGTRAGGGLDDLLGQLGAGGALGGLLGGLAGAAGAAPGRTGAGADAGGVDKAQPSFGDLLNQSLQNFGEPDVPPAPTQEAAAALMLRAMIQAAKADGKVDDAERKKLVNSLGEATAEELAFVKAELAAPVSVERLAEEVPKGLERQVYAMSVMAITLDEKVEAQYLHELAQALGLSPQEVNAIHADVGAIALYA